MAAATGDELPIFQFKARSWEAYMAGIGASGALLAGAIVTFVILIGVVTFKTWPHAGGFLGVGGGDVALQDAAIGEPGQAAGEASGPNLVRLLGGGDGPATQRQGSASGGIRNGQTPEGNLGSPGGSGLTGSGDGEPQGAEPPPSGSDSPNVVAKAVSDVGNNLQGNTQELGDTVNTSTGTNLGDGVTNLGSTLNKNLQSLAGNL
jgi:hypothetical protein